MTPDLERSLVGYRAARRILCDCLAVRFPVGGEVWVERPADGLPRVRGTVVEVNVCNLDWIAVAIPRDVSPWYTTPVLFSVDELARWNPEGGPVGPLCPTGTDEAAMGGGPW